MAFILVASITVSQCVPRPLPCHKWEHTWTIFLHDMADDGGLYAVDNVVTLAGNQVAIADNMYIILDKVSA